MLLRVSFIGDNYYGWFVEEADEEYKIVVIVIRIATDAYNIMDLGAMLHYLYLLDL